MLGARLTSAEAASNCPASAQSGRSSGVEHNLAKVGVEGSNPFARSSLTRSQSGGLASIRLASWREQFDTGAHACQ